MKFKGDRPESSEVESEKYETKTDTTEMTEVKQDITENETQLKWQKWNKT